MSGVAARHFFIITGIYFQKDAKFIKVRYNMYRVVSLHRLVTGNEDYKADFLGEFRQCSPGFAIGCSNIYTHIRKSVIHMSFFLAILAGLAKVLLIVFTFIGSIAFIFYLPYALFRYLFQRGEGGFRPSWTFAVVGLACLLLFVNVVWPRYLCEKEARKFCKCQSNCVKINTALEEYADQHGGRFPESLEELVPEYLEVIPTCPAAGRDTYSESYMVRYDKGADEWYYTFCCKGRHHFRHIKSADCPYFSSSEGLASR